MAFFFIVNEDNVKYYCAAEWELLDKYYFDVLLYNEANLSFFIVDFQSQTLILCSFVLFQTHPRREGNN